MNTKYLVIVDKSEYYIVKAESIFEAASKALGADFKKMKATEFEKQQLEKASNIGDLIEAFPYFDVILPEEVTWL